MAKFYFKRNRVTFIVRPSRQSIIPNPQGVPMVVNEPAKTLVVTGGFLETNDQEIIDRIRKDQLFGTEEIKELTEEEEKIIKIRKKKMQEAEEEIKRLSGEDSELKPEPKEEEPKLKKSKK